MLNRGWEVVCGQFFAVLAEARCEFVQPPYFAQLEWQGQRQEILEACRQGFES